MAADELGIDPVELRKKNFIPPEDFPLTDGHRRQLRRRRVREGARRGVPRRGLRRAAAPSRRRGASGATPMLLGIGVSRLRRGHRGRPVPGVRRRSRSTPTAPSPRPVGTSSHGQGHETAFAMIVSELLGVPMEEVRVVQSDTALVPRGQRHDGLPVAADRRAARSTRRARTCSTRPSSSPRTCSRPSVDDIVLHDGGQVGVAGVPARALSWAELAQRRATTRPDAGRRGSRPRWPPSSTSTRARRPTRSARTSRSSRSTPRPGGVELLRHVAVDDCGRILNPLLVAGPAARRDRAGRRAGAVRGRRLRRRRQPAHRRTSWTTRSRARPSCRASRRRNTETPTPLNPLGAKGIGESGTIGSTPAVQNAVVDALVAPRRPPHRHAAHARSASGARSSDAPTRPADGRDGLRDRRRCG